MENDFVNLFWYPDLGQVVVMKTPHDCEPAISITLQTDMGLASLTSSFKSDEARDKAFEEMDASKIYGMCKGLVEAFGEDDDQ